MDTTNTNESLTGCVICANQTPLFKHLTIEELTIINNHRTYVKFNKGELIHKSGTESSHVISIKKGLAKLYIEDEKGRDKIIKLIKDHDFFVSPGVFSDRRHHFSVKTITESWVCLIDASAFKQIMEVNTKFAFEYMRLINQNLLEITEKMYNMVRKHNTGKIAETLLYLEKDIYNKNPFELTLSTSDIADLSGVGRPSALRILHDLKDENIIYYDKNSIRIINRSRLENLSENA